MLTDAAEDLGPVTDQERLGTPRTWAGGLTPAHVALSVLAIGLFRVVISPLNDLDVYWHVLVGRDIVARHTVAGVGTGWLGVPAPHWTTSQWLAEVLDAQLVAHWGWRGIVVLQLLLLIAILAVLAATLLPGRPALLAVPITAVVAVGATSLTQDRPETFSFPLLALLGFWCARLIGRGRRPPLLAVALLCLVWAQLHGMWILAPAGFALVAVGLAARGRHRDRDAVRGALLAGLASLAGLINPYGPASFTLPLRFQGATAMISEWQPTAVNQLPVWAWAALLLVIVLAWARRRSWATVPELVWVGAWWAFGVLAYRNVVPSLLLTAPVCVAIADRAWGEQVNRLSRASGRTERRLLAALTGVSLLIGLGVGGYQAMTVNPLAKTPALQIARRLAAQPGPLRVFNSYNASGSLAYFGGGKVRLIVDGRADLWGGAYIRRVVGAGALEPGWQQTFTGFHPDAVVLTTEAPLTQLLLHDGNWRLAMTDGHYALLLPNGSRTP